MSTEHSTTAERRAAQMSRLIAEKEDRVRSQRERPLPAWLARRRTRRAIALSPLLPLAGGLYAGTLPDSISRSTLMAVVGAFSVTGILLLRRGTRLLDAAPDHLLDEREIAERNAAYRLTHRFTVALLGLLALLAIADGTVRKATGTALIDGDGWIPITLTAMLVGAMIPAAVLAWRHTETED